MAIMSIWTEDKKNVLSNLAQGFGIISFTLCVLVLISLAYNNIKQDKISKISYTFGIMLSIVGAIFLAASINIHNFTSDTYSRIGYACWLLAFTAGVVLIISISVFNSAQSKLRAAEYNHLQAENHANNNSNWQNHGTAFVSQAPYQGQYNPYQDQVYYGRSNVSPNNVPGGVARNRGYTPAQQGYGQYPAQQFNPQQGYYGYGTPRQNNAPGLPGNVPPSPYYQEATPPVGYNAGNESVAPGSVVPEPREREVSENLVNGYINDDTNVNQVVQPSASQEFSVSEPGNIKPIVGHESDNSRSVEGLSGAETASGGFDAGSLSSDDSNDSQGYIESYDSSDVGNAPVSDSESNDK